MWKEFREFAVKGNMIDLAIGIIIGAAFGKVITSFVNDVLMPPIGLLLGKVDFNNLYVNLSGEHYTSMAEASKAGAPILKYGIFLNTVIDFIIVAFVIFIIIKQLNRFKKKAAATEPATKECPFCLSNIPIKASRCPSCTSDLEC
ncbi:MAG: large-conductance mechanosensitive channel protein MscL [Syntrophomonadaceae bacterium]|nr:large-conductance mechanosensitive channel protein MscL [Syntrophomonadaceae bacterium]MDD3022575.1 large-conductance mechanosensitive channel protein MscL [Syntrophomonadaceae bacterium]